MKKALISIVLIVLLSFGLCFAAIAEGNNTYDTAVSVTFDQIYSDSNQKETCWYKVTLPASGMVKVQFDAVRDNPYGKFYIVLYNDKVEKMGTFEHSFNSLTNEAMGTEQIYLKEGFYYFQLYGFSSGWYPTYTFTAKFSLVGTDETIPESTANSNDTYGTATEIQLDTAYNEQISRYGDTVDHYRFSLSSDGHIRVVCKAFMEKIKITIRDDQGNEKWTAIPAWNSVTGCSDYTSDDVALSAGAYYIDFQSVQIRTVITSGVYNFKLLSHRHEYHEVYTSATLTKDGQLQYVCDCGDIQSTTVIPHPATIKLNKTSFVFTGKTITPVVIVKDADGKSIDKSNYKVTYAAGRKFPGDYKVTITFQKYYEACGTVERSFTIAQKGTAIKNLKAGKKQFTVKWKKIAAVTGYQIQYSTSADFTDAKTVSVKKKVTSLLTIRKLKKGQIYYVRVRTVIKGKGATYYSTWCKARKVKIK